MNHIRTYEEFLNEARRPGTGEIAVMKADRSKAEKIMKSMNLAYVDAGDNHGRAKLHWYEIPDADMDLLNKIGDAVDVQIMRVNENGSEINEAKMTWFPKEISVLKDIYIGKNSVWTSTGENTGDFVIKKGGDIKLAEDGGASKTKAGTYEVMVNSEEDHMYFSLKELAELIKQKAISIKAGAYGHDLTLNSMLK
jgi:hypothetical protein